jgi:hypothetical protein
VESGDRKQEASKAGGSRGNGNAVALKTPGGACAWQLPCCASPCTLVTRHPQPFAGQWPEMSRSRSGRPYPRPATGGGGAALPAPQCCTAHCSASSFQSQSGASRPRPGLHPFPAPCFLGSGLKGAPRTTPGGGAAGQAHGWSAAVKR